MRVEKSVIDSIEKYRYTEYRKVLRYIIPKQNKDKIKKQLRLLGINESYIYPELDTGANYIKDQYLDN